MVCGKQMWKTVCNHYEIHPLLIEDILEVNQRPKMDEGRRFILPAEYVALQMNRNSRDRADQYCVG